MEKNDLELTNTQRKLTELERLIQKREQSTGDSPAQKLSLGSMRRFACKLRADIDQYTKLHQTA
jgi:hypothetical protein